ncbi:MAG: c-type cytochrome [Bacteroidetes bacterium]|nr:c-type cytochrome [Bacteroidota bacterium]
MKKVLKIAGYTLGAVVLLLAIGAGYVNFSPLPKYEVVVPDYPQFKPDSTMIAEGKRTFTLVCNNCHMAESGKLEGKFLPEIPEFFGKAWSANITSHPVYGSGRYSNAELANLLRTGIQKDGDFVPFMPQFKHMSDEDIRNIIAYLRSDAPELAPSDVAQPAVQPSFIGKLLCRTIMKPAPYPTSPISVPPAGDAVALGKYLVTAKLDCYGCHSPSFMEIDGDFPEKTPGYLSGGNELQDMEGQPIFSRNLTPDKETGLGNWTEEQFVKAVKTGIRPNGPALRFPMTPFTALTDEEAKAIWAYLQTVPAINHDVNKLEKKP